MGDKKMKSKRIITPEPMDDFYREYVVGTTTMGFIYDEGVMVTLDHSLMKKTVWVRKKNKMKPRKVLSDAFPENMILLNSHLLASFSGGSERSREYLLNQLPMKCQEHESEVGRKSTAAEASGWLAEFLSLHPDSDDSFSIGILIAGWDEASGPALYKVNGKGKLLKDSSAGTGCASAICPSVKDKLPWSSFDINMSKDEAKKFAKKTLINLSKDEAKDFAKRTLCLAVSLAHERRECVSVFDVGRTGVQRVVSNEDIVELQKSTVAKLGESGKTCVPTTKPWLVLWKIGFSSKHTLSKVGLLVLKSSSRDLWTRISRLLLWVIVSIRPILYIFLLGYSSVNSRLEFAVQV